MSATTPVTFEASAGAASSTDMKLGAIEWLRVLCRLEKVRNSILFTNGLENFFNLCFFEYLFSYKSIKLGIAEQHYSGILGHSRGERRDQHILAPRMLSR